MSPSIFDPPILGKVIKKKERQLVEIESQLERLPLDHPDRLSLFERREYLRNGIPPLRKMLTEAIPDQHPIRHSALNTQVLTFRRRNGRVTVLEPYTSESLLKTYESLSQTLNELRIRIINSEGQIQADTLKKEFGKTLLGKASTNQNWLDWPEVFWGAKARERATARGVALSLLAQTTGKERSTLKTKLSGARTKPKTSK